MKNSKKLLILVLSLVLLVGVFATAVSAEGSEKASVTYPDGTVVEYAVGETIVAPEGETYAGKGNTLYVDDDVPGWIYTLEDQELADLTVTEAMVGKNIVASGFNKVYLGIALAEGETTYYYDAETAGAGLKSFFLGSDNATSAVLTLYEDFSSGVATIYGNKNKTFAIDLNGHQLSLTATGSFALDIYANHFSIYSSQPGGVLRAEKATTLFRTNNNDKYTGGRIDGTLWIGEKEGYKEGTDPSYGANLTVYCNQLNNSLYGNGAYVNGGTYIQLETSTATNFILMSRKSSSEYSSTMQNIKNATFVVCTALEAVVHYQSSAARTFTNCTFINTADAVVPIFVELGKVTTSSTSSSYSKTQNATFSGCSFYRVSPMHAHTYDFKHTNTKTNEVQEGQITFKVTYTNCMFGGNAPTAPAGAVVAHGTPKTVTANGASYTLDMTFATDVSTVYGINWAGAYTDYWTLGSTPFYVDGEVFNHIEEKANGTAVYYGDASFDPSVFAVVTEEMLGTVSNAVASYAVIEPVAFKWTKTDGTVEYVALEEGMTKAEIGQAFHTLFDTVAFACEIKLYADLEIPAAMGWGPLGRSDSADEYKSLSKGSVTLDLNGHIFSIPALTQGVNLSNSNSLGSYGHASEVIFGFEINSANTFTLKSSLAGAQILNASSLALFGLGEGAAANIVIDGENITYIGVGSLSHALETNSSSVNFTVNGGTYVITGNKTAISYLANNISIKNATIVLLGDAPTALFGAHYYKNNASFKVENSTIYSKNKTKLFVFLNNNGGVQSAPRNASATYTVDFKDCALSGIDLENIHASLDGVTYDGVMKADNETNLKIAYNGTLPADTVRYTYKVAVVYGEEKLVLTFIGNAAESELLYVDYGAAAEGEYYLPGSFFTPVEAETLASPYYELENKLFVDIEGYLGAMTNAYVPADLAGQTLVAADYINYVEKPLAYVVLLDGAPVAHGYLASASIGADLAASAALADEGSVIALYVDVAVDTAIANAAAVTLDLQGHRVLVSAAFAPNASLAVKNGEIVVIASLASLFDGAASLENVAVYNLAEKTALTSATAAVKNAKIYNLTLAGATLDGTVFYTESADAFANGVEGNLVYNNNLENLAVGDETYEIVFTLAATDDADKVAVATFKYKDEVKGEITYYAGSIPGFKLVAIEGYYYLFETEDPILASAEFACAFIADSSKIAARMFVTEKLNMVFYLQKQEGLENLMLNGVLIDFASLAIENIEGTDYYVLPYAFVSFADSLDALNISVDIVFGDMRETVSLDASLVDYAKGILADPAAEQEDKTLVYALLVYVDSVAKYFGYERETDPKALINAYAEYQTAYVAPADVEPVQSDYIHGALFIVKEKVSLALRVDPDFKGVTKVSYAGKEISFIYKDIQEIDGKSYLIVPDISYAELASDFEIEVELYGEVAESFTYSLAAYTQAMTVQNMGYAPAYAKALYNFVNLAAAYAKA